ncbi:hypothetical protein XBP1_2820071 [Xenorhabdus bovienii str. puntauvense]|uniref:Uncharacterized protein n=1 Tax=Xenorhabdus bovienii str. puntauvense TaxID=1398201 RepID=A0A077NHF2_XENBV|nr:hypothetical protein XBP1_2820071 [Xenorhabdus bovienii str. puntauvense]
MNILRFLNDICMNAKESKQSLVSVFKYMQGTAGRKYRTDEYHR